MLDKIICLEKPKYNKKIILSNRINKILHDIDKINFTITKYEDDYDLLDDWYVRKI